MFCSCTAQRTCRRVGALGLTLALLVAAPARLFAASDDAQPPGRGAPAHRLLRDPAGLSAWLRDHHPELKASRARERQAQAETRGARLFQNPVLDSSLSNIPLSETNPKGQGFKDSVIVGVGVSQMFELGKRGPRTEAAALRERAAQFDTAATLSDRITTARDALGLAVQLGLRVSILAESLEDAERAATLEHTRLEQKALSGMDYDRLLLDLANLRAEFARSQAEYAAAQADCAAALAAECDLTGATEDDLAAAPVDTAHAEERLEARPDVRSLGLEAAASERDARLAANRAIPDVTLRVGYVYDRYVAAGDIAHTLNFGVSLPLPFVDHGQHDATRAREHALEVDAEKESTLEEARADVRGLLSRKAALERNIETLEKDTLPRSTGVLASAERAFHEGGVSLTDFLLSRRNHIALSLTRLDQRFELFQIENELNRVLGLNPTTPQGTAPQGKP
jgi:cobalt-zinc-cadmium efflux system outer membrane protein